MVEAPNKSYSDAGLANDWLASEGPGRISRDQGLLAPLAADAPSGTVLGQITASSLYVPLAPAAGDGSQVAAAVLHHKRKINAANQRCTLISRIAEIVDNRLTWPAGITTNQKKTAQGQLAAKFLICR